MNIKLTKKEKDLLIRVVVYLVILIGVFKGAEWLDTEYAQKQNSRNSELKASRSDYTQRLGQISDEEKVQQQYVSSYQNFVELGVIGSEQRLNWVEKLQSIARKRRLYDISYEIDNQLQFASDQFAFSEGSSVIIQATSMKFTMPMLHDLDFLMFMEDYASSVEGTFVPLTCDISLDAFDTFEVELKANFNATCQVEWLSVFDPEAQLESSEGKEQA